MDKKHIEDLVHSMTLREKLAEMTQLTPAFLGADDSIDPTGPLNRLHLSKDDAKSIGSVLNSFGAEKMIAMQKKHLQENPHGIPLLFMSDVIHGYATLFPIPLAFACSFNPSVCEKAAAVTAEESAVSGIHVTFSPMCDLVRDPRWGRVKESFGEDPYLNSLMAAAAVRGYQGSSLKEHGRIAACVKHFAGYGAAEAGREYNTVDVSQGMLLEYYLEGYCAAVNAGAAMVMTSFNIVGRIPASINRQLVHGILREQWRFDGVVISDFAALRETIVHGAAGTEGESAQKGIQAGVDVEMMSANYLNCIPKLVEQGKIPLSLIDEAVTRILELKNSLGLFENPYKDADPQREKEIHLCKAHREAARDAARKSAVLLKNQGVLPLKKGIRIGLAGPFATSRNVLGGWPAGYHEEAVSLYEGLTAKMPEALIKTAMTQELGSMLDGVFDVDDRVEEACETLSNCDVILAAVGENPDDTGEGTSKTNLRLSPHQEKLVTELKKIGKPLIAIIFSGRPMEIKPVCESADAVIQAWFLGAESGNALADILCGDYNPSGRLAMSFPQNVGQIPVYYNSFNTGRPCGPNCGKYVSRYLDCPNEPLFCFGYGLSYSNFVYGNFTVGTTGNKITASVTVKNQSEYEGTETVQLYIHDVAASVVRPVRELKGIQQVTLAPWKERTVVFTVTKDMLKFYNESLQFVFEPGEFDIMVGRNSGDVLTKRIDIN